MLDASLMCVYIQCMERDQMHLRIRAGFQENLDRLRKEEPDLPSRTEMLHRLVSKAAKAIEGTRPA